MMGNALLHTCSEVTFNKTHLLMTLLTNQLTRNTRQAVTSEWVFILEYPYSFCSCSQFSFLFNVYCRAYSGSFHPLNGKKIGEDMAK